MLVPRTCGDSKARAYEPQCHRSFSRLALATQEPMLVVSRLV
jgi:hypothetical protein